jgi:hypothetical protein
VELLEKKASVNNKRRLSGDIGNGKVEMLPWLKNTWEGASIKTNLPDVLRQISSILIFLVPNLV